MADATHHRGPMPPQPTAPRPGTSGPLDWDDRASFPESEALIGRLAFVDLSLLPRLGFKGRGTIPAMQARGIVVRAEPNRGFCQADGGLCLVLGAGEVLLLSGLDGDDGRLAHLERTWRIEDEERTYPLPRRDSHAWMAVAGPAAPEMFSKLCAVDLSPEAFADLAIAQTSVARLNAIVTRVDLGSTPTFHLLADSASAAYLRACLLDAGTEFGGHVAGLEALRTAGGRDHGTRTGRDDPGRG